MNKLDKIKLMLQTIKEHNLTAYEIGKHTKISTFAIQKIINGDTKNPNETTVDIILSFLEKAIVGTDVKENTVNEPHEVYKNSVKTSTEKCLEDLVKLHKHINYLEAMLHINSIKFTSLNEKEEKIYLQNK